MQSTLESAFKEIYEQIKNLKVFESSDESFVGRFAHKYTSIVFTVCFMIHRIHSFGDLNIYCIFSNEISSDDTKEFSRRFCWASNTYYVPSDRTLPHKGETREYRITYYQWVPWILMFCAFFVMTPFKIWHYLTKGSRFDLEKIMIYVLKAKEKEEDSEEFKEILYKLTNLIEKPIKTSKLGLTDISFIFCYTITRTIYLFNTFIIFWLLNYLLGQNFYSLYGFKLIKEIWLGKANALESQFFPRITMCDVPIRSTGNNINWYVVQCALPINVFNEKIFIFLWFWNAFIFTGTTLSTLKFFLNHLIYPRQAFVKRFLKLQDENKIQFFVSKYLTSDVFFILRKIEEKGNYQIICKTILLLWRSFNTIDC